MDIETLKQINDDAKKIRAFLQGLAYANGCKSDSEVHLENAWYYSDKVRTISVRLDQLIAETQTLRNKVARPLKRRN